jgi:hypothetical protein
MHDREERAHVNLRAPIHQLERFATLEKSIALQREKPQMS